MKQITECLDRFRTGKKPLNRKWKAFRGDWVASDDLLRSEHILLLYHYHHLVLVFNTEQNVVIYEWWDRPADKRGLDAAKEYLEPSPR